MIVYPPDVSSEVVKNGSMIKSESFSRETDDRRLVTRVTLSILNWDFVTSATSRVVDKWIISSVLGIVCVRLADDIFGSWTKQVCGSSLEIAAIWC